MLTVTVVDASVVDAGARLEVLVVDQDEKENGPVGAVLNVTDAPLSYQPSAVGDAPSVIGVVPVRVVVSVQGPPVPEMVLLEIDPPAQLLEEYDSAEGHVADQLVLVLPPGKPYPTP